MIILNYTGFWLNVYNMKFCFKFFEALPFKNILASFC